jgi:hypothetical protein
VNKSRRIRGAGHVKCMGEVINANILLRKPEGKIPLGKPPINGSIMLEWAL